MLAAVAAFTAAGTAAAAPPPAYRIGALPELGEARFTLEGRLMTLPVGSQARADIAWLLQADRIVHHSNAPEGRRYTVEQVLRVNAWWFATRTSPNARVIVHGADGVLFNYRKGYGFVFNPVATAGRWQRLNASVPVQGLATSLAPYAVARTYGTTKWLAFEYFDDRERPTQFIPGTSGMAQARLAQVFSAAWTRTADPRFAKLAFRTVAFFTVPTSAEGGRALLPDPLNGRRLLWFPERVYPGDDPWKGAALNGFMAALVDLYSVWTRLGMPMSANTTSVTPYMRSRVAKERILVRTLAERGTRSVAQALPFHDTGSWSIYGLRTVGYGTQPLVADLNYHCYHIALLRSLERRMPGLGLVDRARVWQAYVNRKGLKCPVRPNSGIGGAPEPSIKLPPEPDLPPLTGAEPPDPPPPSLM